MTSIQNTPPVLLIPGHWLGAWAWDEVTEHLEGLSLSPTAVTLPGLDPADPDRASRTLEDQVAAIVDLMHALGVSASSPAVLVAHSGANAPVSIVIDRHPAFVSRVIWVDSGPMMSGGAFAPDLPPEVQDLPLPPFDALGRQASLDGLDAGALDRFRSHAVPEPGGLLRQEVMLSDERRRRVPTTLVCCSMSSAQVVEMADAGHPMFEEVAELTDRELVDLPTGHWPMWSRPADLAAVIRAAIVRAD